MLRRGRRRIFGVVAVSLVVIMRVLVLALVEVHRVEHGAGSDRADVEQRAESVASELLRRLEGAHHEHRPVDERGEHHRVRDRDDRDLSVFRNVVGQHIEYSGEPEFHIANIRFADDPGAIVAGKRRLQYRLFGYYDFGGGRNR